MRVSFAHLGSAYVYLEPFLTLLGLEPIVPPFTSKRTLDLGVRHCPEMICAPCKILFGNYLEALELGADTLIMFGGRNVCRLGYAVESQQARLHELGYEFRAVTFRLRYAQSDLMEVTRFLTGKPIWALLGPVRFLLEAMKVVDGLERLSLQARAHEVNRGDSDRILREAWTAIRTTHRREDLAEIDHTFRARLAAIAQIGRRDVLRVAFVGDPFTILDSFFNMDIERKLAVLGVAVERWFWLGNSLNLFPIKDWLRMGHWAQVQRAAAPYIQGEIGGFGYSTVGETILRSREGYDGLIHLSPFNCTPEVVAESILVAYDQQSPVPILHLSFDEHTSATGLMTRLEAYTDMLRRNRARSA